MKSAETRARISAAKMGHEVTPEARAKFSASVSRALIGRPVAEVTRARIAAKQAGENGHNWQGDQVGYSGIHERARVALPLSCAHADTTCAGKLEVALRRDAAGPLREDRRGFYSPRIEDYFRLCRSHHNRYDGKRPPAPRTRHALART